MKIHLAFLSLSLAFASAAAPFTIVSYNIHHGGTLDDTLDVPRAGRVVAAERPRFAGIQEVDMKTKRVNGLDSCAELAKATGLHATFAKGIDYGGGEYGVAFLSRERPLSVRRIPLPGKEPRVLLLCEFEDCWAGTTHLDLAKECRIKSIAVIEKAVKELSAKKAVFLTGDWNANPASAELGLIRRFMRVISCEDTATFHSTRMMEAERVNANRCIDFIAVDAAHASRYRISGARVVEDRRTSDHAPVRVTVDELPNGGR
jgi:endonuclease/exonuclease/phosphatase family metal-dependent hydrolase